MLEVVIQDIVGGRIGLRHIIALHKGQIESLLAEERPDFLDGIALGIDLCLRQTQVDQYQQSDAQFLQGFPTDVRNSRDHRL